jgi:lysyl endopeptidase
VMKASHVFRLVLLLVVAVILVLGWTSPAAAGGRAYDEAPMQVMTKGLTAEQHVRQQIELSARLSRELPAGVLERATRIPLTREEVDSIDRASRQVSPLRIGLVKAMTPEIEVAGLSRESLTRTAGGFVWAAAVRSEGSGAIRLHVQDLLLPRNAELYVYNRGGQAFGPFTGAGPTFSGEIWTTAVFGAEAILQLRLSSAVSEADLRSVSFRVAEVGLITQKFAGELLDSAFDALRPPTEAAPPPPGWPCGNPNCVVDASCVNGTPADPAKLAVAKMEWIQGAFIYTCTGGLLSDNNPAQSNFFLTANHCISKNNAAQSASFYWRFATSSCNASSCPSNGGWPFVTTGSTVSKTGRKGDFTLLHLNANPPSGSVLLGWTSAPVANTNGAQLYRISNPNFGPQVYSQHNVDTAVGTCSGWPRGERIYTRDITGAIDGGSSGSPIVNSSSQVVGQLSGTCGFNPSNPCSSGPGEDNATVDGAFAFYYSLVQPIIDP